MRKNVGSLELVGEEWQISCEPHVRAKFKRYFSKVSQGATDIIKISNTRENCDEILWFLQQFPMEMSLADSQYIKAESEKQVALKNDIQNILEYKNKNIQFELAEPAYEDQKIAAQLLMKVEGLLLADDLGLGKTVSAICAMVFSQNLPALFVTLTHLPSQIQSEINRFAPQLKTHILNSTKTYSLADKDGVFPDVIICSYSKLDAWAEYLAGQIVYLILDECQELRTGESSLKYCGAKLIADKARLRLGLSATPFYGYGHEMFNVIQVLRPNLLGTRQEFYREWCDFDNKKIQNPVAFGAYLRDEGAMLIRKKQTQHLTQLVHHIDCDEDIFEREVSGRAAELAKIILKSSQDFQGQKLQATQDFNLLMRQSTGIAKAPYVAAFVRMLVETGESVILFGWHRAVYDLWMEHLADFNPVLYTGSESVKEKEKAKQIFLKNESKILIISLRSGAGLDGLQYHPNCSIGVFGELDWSSGVHAQCGGRLDRNGQNKKVIMYYLLSETGSDPIMADVLGLKKNQLDGVMTIDEELITKLEGDTGAIKRLAQQYLTNKMDLIV